MVAAAAPGEQPALSMAALVIAYAPIALSTVALALALSVVMIGGLVGRRLYA
jgi:hypothetical protein